jgi:beta-phosphoglucomutase
MLTATLPQAVLFDLDGVLTDTARFHYVAWKALADSLGVPFDDAMNERLKGIDRMASLDIILAAGSFSLDDDLKRELAERKNEHYKSLVAAMTPADLLPGAWEALRSVRAAGMKSAICSVSRNALEVLRHLGILGEVDLVVDAARIVRGKPNPEIFLTGAAMLGTRTEACIGIEDAIAGVRAIKAAGMYAVGIGDPAILTEADEVLPSLAWFDLERYGVCTR